MADPREEEFAALAHEQWSGWMKYLFSKCVAGNFLEHETYELDRAIPAEFVERWTRQMNTSYADLSEEEKESDRVEARKVLALLKETV